MKLLRKYAQWTNGRIADESTLEELLTRCEEMQQLWQMDTAVTE